MTHSAIPEIALRGLKAALRPARKRLSGVAARAEKDYATHIPILLGLARVTKVENVLELGCGDYSTRMFLNSTAFPSLVSLHSLETDQAWLDKIHAAVGDDPRVSTQFVSNGMRSMIDQMNLEKYDLIFVDDSTSADDRAATIRAISANRPQRAVVAIHDFEIQAYREAAAAFQNQFTFKAFNPQTGIVWNGDKDLSKALRKTSSVIKHFAEKVQPDDVSGWQVALSA
jgi:predicted O-methyltransferase YrrM